MYNHHKNRLDWLSVSTLQKEIKLRDDSEAFMQIVFIKLILMPQILILMIITKYARISIIYTIYGAI